MLRAANRPVLAYFDAIKNLRLRQVAMILKAGYDPNLLINGRGQNGLQFMINYFGATDAHFRLQAPLNMAAYLGIARLLLDSGLDANTVDLLSGETIIFDAIRFNDRDMVALLLHFADFSIRNKNGESAVMCAARFGSKQVMRMILEHLRHLEMDGYYLRQRNRFGLTALEMARAENLECAKVLTKHLISYGHHVGASAALARSSSHHQLAYHRQLAAPSGVVPYALAAAADSGSDYEDALLSAVSPAYGLPKRGSRKLVAAPYYDPQAAHFSRYLMEQQELGAEPQQQANEALGGSGYVAGGVGANSDENSDDGPLEGRFYGPGGASLTRSRSCVLGGGGGGTTGGAGSSKQRMAGASNSGAGQGGAKKAPDSQGKLGASYNWDAAGRGAGCSN